MRSVGHSDKGGTSIEKSAKAGDKEEAVPPRERKKEHLE